MAGPGPPTNSSLPVAGSMNTSSATGSMSRRRVSPSTSSGV
jgi:hypothetical protein